MHSHQSPESQSFDNANPPEPSVTPFGTLDNCQSRTRGTQFGASRTAVERPRPKTAPPKASLQYGNRNGKRPSPVLKFSTMRTHQNRSQRRLERSTINNRQHDTQNTVRSLHNGRGAPLAETQFQKHHFNMGTAMNNDQARISQQRHSGPTEPFATPFGTLDDCRPATRPAERSSEPP